MYVAYRQPVCRDIVAHYPRIRPACQWRITDRIREGAGDLGRKMALHRRLPDCRVCVTENHIRGLLADHVDRAHNEEAGDPWEDGGIDHAQSSHTVHLKVPVEYTALVQWTNRTTARRVMPPCIVANIVAQPFVRVLPGNRATLPLRSGPSLSGGR